MMTPTTTVSLTGGVGMPLLGFGTWQLTGRAGYEAVLAALALGYRHIDTATIYGNEAEVGRAIRDSGIPRAEIFVTTKVPPDRAGKARHALAASLRALETDYVDLWLIHWPPRVGRGLAALWQEVVQARVDGLTRAAGVSNFSTAQIDELAELPAVNQIPWSPFDYDPVVMAQSRQRGVALEGYSAFKRSDLHHPVLTEVARVHAVTAAQVVLRWHLQHEIVVIPKSATPHRIAANADIFGFSLDDADMARIDALGTGSTDTVSG